MACNKRKADDLAQFICIKIPLVKAICAVLQAWLFSAVTV
jgi:hypothetical protein